MKGFTFTLIGLLVLLGTGCVNTQITESETFYTNDKVTKTVTKTYPAPHAVKTITFGIDIGIDENKIPRVRFGIVKCEYIVGNDKVMPTIDEEYNDIHLLLGKGTVTSNFGVTVFGEVKENKK